MLLLVSSFVSPVLSDQAKWLTLHGDGFEVRYPDTWELDESGIGGSTFMLFGRPAAAGRFRENVNLVVQDISGMSLTLDSYAELSLEQIPGFLPNATILESEKLKSDAGEFYHLVYKGDYNSMPLQFKQFYWVKGTKAYVLTLTCTVETYNNFLADAEGIMRSFRIK